MSFKYQIKKKKNPEKVIEWDDLSNLWDDLRLLATADGDVTVYMTVDRDTRHWSYNINVAVCHKSGRLANLIRAEGEKDPSFAGTWQESAI